METLFEKFNVISCLKKTEFSTVYLADHIFLEKRIILKTLDLDKSVDSTDLPRFKREAQILAKLNHPNIISVLDFGIFQNFVYISFEYFPSQTLREIINTKKLKNTKKIDLLKQASKGLAYAHHHNIVHRDIKPENILVDKNLRLKIADFGLALSGENTHLTHPASVMGTPAYLSPEQVSGEMITPASDLFSLGLIAFELFTHSNPIIGADLGQTINNIINFNTSKYNDLISQSAEESKDIIRNLLNPDPAKRYIPSGLIKEEDYPVQADLQRPISKMLWFSISIIMIALFIIFYNYSGTFSTPQKSIQILKQGPDKQKKVQISEQNRNRQQMEESNLKTVIHKPDPIKKTGQNVIDNKARLKIESVPPATIFINSEKIGSTSPNEPVELKAGSYQIILKNEDYPDYTQNIELKTAEQLTISINLNEHSGLMQVFAYPWAVVSINGKQYGQTPLENPIRLIKGLYTVALKNPGFEDFKKTFEINGNDTIIVQHNFNKQGFGTKIETE